MDVDLERGVVALLRVVEMNEEENVRPDVMLLADVVLETLPKQNQQPTAPLISGFCLFPGLFFSAGYLSRCANLTYHYSIQLTL